MKNIATTFYADDLQGLEDQINDWISTAKAGSTIINVTSSSITEKKGGGYGCLLIYTKYAEVVNQF